MTVETEEDTESVEETATDATDASEASDESPDETPDTDDGSNVTAIVNATTVQSTLDSIGALVDECKIHFDDDGIAIRAVDPANVGMVDLKLDAEAFESYNPTGAVVGVNLDRLTDIAGMADSDQLIQLNLEENGKLHIRIGGLTYNLALIDPDSIRQEPDVPELDLPAEITLEGNDLDRGIKAADMVSDHIRLAASHNDRTFSMNAEGDTDDVDLQLEEDDLIDLRAGDADSLYSLEYLKDMVKAIDGDTAVTLDLGEEFPVKLHFDYSGGDGHVTYMLAPRIQSD